MGKYEDNEMYWLQIVRSLKGNFLSPFLCLSIFILFYQLANLLHNFYFILQTIVIESAKKYTLLNFLWFLEVIRLRQLSVICLEIRRIPLAEIRE